MTNRKILFELITPERVLVRQEVDEVIAPGILGEFGVLPEHTTFLTLLGSGEVTYKIDGSIGHAAVSGGFAEVGPERVIILAEAAEMPEEIDLERAEKAKERAEIKLQLLTPQDEEYAYYDAVLKRALNRLHVAKRIRRV